MSYVVRCSSPSCTARVAVRVMADAVRIGWTLVKWADGQRVPLCPRCGKERQ